MTCEDVNAYPKELAGLGITAKDFRAWHTTVMAAVAPAVSQPVAHSETARRRAIARAAHEVAGYRVGSPPQGPGRLFLPQVAVTRDCFPRRREPDRTVYEELVETLPGARRKLLLTGWFSFLHGEVTAGDVLALDRVRDVLGRADIAHDVAWSPGFRPEALHLADVRPEEYSHLVFVCGPVHGRQIEELHLQFPHCVRIAVGTSVVAPDSPAVTGFHRVLARDASDVEPGRDLAARAPARPPRPVFGVVLTHGQHEYGRQRRHEQVAEQIKNWLVGMDCARLELDTRLDTCDWRLCATPAQLESVLTRLDLVVTDRLHGLVLALRAGVPALAIDPVEGGAKVTAQARACDWPALVPGERLNRGELERWSHWCLTSGQATARKIAAEFREGVVRDGADRLVEVVQTRQKRAG